MESHFEIGNDCPHKNCSGVLKTWSDGSCNCHIHPPCSHCIEKNRELYCVDCGLNPYEYEPKEWEVVKYWDNIYDYTVASNLTKSEAEKLLKNYKRTIYTTYGVRKMLPIKKTFVEWLDDLKSF